MQVNELDAKLKIVNDVLSYSAALRGPEDMFHDYQALLSKLGTLALPPSGHSCPSCSRAGSLYCVQVAIDRLRGLRA